MLCNDSWGSSQLYCNLHSSEIYITSLRNTTFTLKYDIFTWHLAVRLGTMFDHGRYQTSSVFGLCGDTNKLYALSPVLPTMVMGLDWRLYVIMAEVEFGGDSLLGGNMSPQNRTSMNGSAGHAMSQFVQFCTNCVQTTPPTICMKSIPIIKL